MAVKQVLKSVIARFISENLRWQSDVEVGSVFNILIKPEEACWDRKSTVLFNSNKPNLRNTRLTNSIRRITSSSQYSKIYPHKRNSNFAISHESIKFTTSFRLYTSIIF